MSSTKIVASMQPAWNHPRTMMVIVLQLFYGFVVLLPMVYYLFGLHKMEEYQARFGDNATKVLIYFLIGYTLASVTMFLLAELLFFEYFWIKEKIRKNREPLYIASKASLTVAILYFVFLYFFGLYLFPKIELYSKIRLTVLNEIILFTILTFVSIYAVAFGLLEHRKDIMKRVLKGKFIRFRK